MSNFKKIIAVVIALVMVLTIVACTQNTQTETTSGDKTESTTTAEKTTSDGTTLNPSTEETAGTETTSSSEEVTTIETTETTTGKDPVEYISGYDPVDEKVGSYVTLEYNPMYCSVKSEVKKGLGSKETVTLTVTMKDGYVFDGWTSIDYLCNLPNYSDTKPETVAKRNAISDSVTYTETYSFTADKDIKVFVNCSMKVVYDANGGKTSDGKTSLDTSFCLSEFKCPSTLPDKGYFTRDGYVLSEYNTKADGTGTAVSLGSKIRSDSSTLTLYCIWLKTNEASDFTYSTGSEITITGYKGTAKDVVIPETIEGKKVTVIAENAFNGKSIETAFIPKTVKTVKAKAFVNCSSLTTIVFFDNVSFEESWFDPSSGVVSKCPNFKYVRVNAVYDMYNVGWITGTYCKTDRLVWAADMQKFIIYGGSGSLYGFDCSQINEKIGEDYVVINMGANANTSAAFVFEGMQKYLNEGDIVLWDPEPGNNTLGDNTIGHRCIPFYVMGNYDFLKGIDISKHKGFFGYLMNAIQEKKNGSVCSFEMGNKTINCYGDATGKRVTQGKSFQYRFDYFTSRNDYSRMTYIIDELKKDGVQVWFSYAVMDENLKLNEWAHQGQTIEGVAEQYTADILKNFDVTIISDFFDCTVPNEYFYDSEWHLTNEGAVLRTSKLLVDILAQFEKIGKKY